MAPEKESRLPLPDHQGAVPFRLGHELHLHSFKAAVALHAPHVSSAPGPESLRSAAEELAEDCRRALRAISKESRKHPRRSETGRQLLDLRERIDQLREDLTCLASLTRMQGPLPAAAVNQLKESFPRRIAEIEAIEIEKAPLAYRLLQHAHRFAAIVTIAGASFAISGDAGRSGKSPPGEKSPVVLRDPAGSQLPPAVPAKQSATQSLFIASENRSVKAAEEINQLGTAHKADLRGEGQPGRQFEEGVVWPRADVRFPWFSDIKDNLWRTGVSARHADGTFRIVKNQTHASPGASVQAEVTRYVSAEAGSVLCLNTPLNFAPSNVRIEKGQGFEVDSASRTVTFHQACNPVIHYDVVRGREEFHLPSPVHLEYAREALQTATIEELRNSDDHERILDGYFRNFLYVSSSDLQSIISKVPASQEEITAGLRLGDCDTLAQLAAALLNEAGKDAAVSLGVLGTEESITQDRAHAKLVHFDSNGGPRSYECTRSVSAGYVNLMFKEDDRRRLEAVVSKMSPSDAPQARLMHYQAFNDELRAILEDPYYRIYRADPGGTGSSRTDLTFFKELGKAFVREATGHGPWVQKLVAGVTALGVLQAGFFAVLGLRRYSGRRWAKAVHSSAKRLALSNEFDDVTGNEPRGLPVREELAERTASCLRAREVDLRQAGGRVFFKDAEIEELGSDGQRRLLKAIHTARLLYPNGRGAFGFVTTLVNRVRWWRTLDRVDRGEIKADSIVPEIRRHCVDRNQIQAFREQLDELARSYLLAGSEFRVPLPWRELSPDTLLHGDGSGSNASDPLRTLRRPVDARGEFFDRRRYRPGDDPRMIDWKLAGKRDELWINRAEMPAGREPRLPISLVIDVAHPSAHEFRVFCSLLAENQRPDSRFRIESIRFKLYGGQIDEIPPALMRRLPAEGAAGALSITRKALALCLDHSLADCLLTKRARRNESVRAFHESLSRSTPPGMIDPSRRTIFIGPGAETITDVNVVRANSIRLEGKETGAPPSGSLWKSIAPVGRRTSHNLQNAR